MDVKAHVEAALARIIAAAGPPTAEAMEEDEQSRESSRKVGEADEEDEQLEIVGPREGHEVELPGTEVADRARPRRGRWKPASSGPRGGACGRMHPGSHTLNRQCRREYPRICSSSSKPSPAWGPLAYASTFV